MQNVTVHSVLTDTPSEKIMGLYILFWHLKRPLRLRNHPYKNGFMNLVDI